jgi:hypothetical protein
MDPTRATDGEAATGELLTAAVGDRCTSCQAPFAPDQHYCVNCGERRGKPRFSLAAMTTPAAAQPSTTPSSRASRRPRASAGFTLIAGVGTLLLAMGVGVLIGRNGNTTTQRAGTPPVQVVSVNGGGTAAPAQSSSGSGGGSPKAKQGRVIHISKKVTAAAAAAASKVLGASAKNLPPPTVTVGQAGHGAGYQGGHFTGNFFGQ